MANGHRWLGVKKMWLFHIEKHYKFQKKNKKQQPDTRIFRI